MKAGLKITKNGFVKAVFLNNGELTALSALVTLSETELLSNWKGAILTLRSPEESDILYKALFKADETFEERDKQQLRTLLSWTSSDFESFIEVMDVVSVNIAQELIDKGYVVFDGGTDDYIVRIPLFNPELGVMETSMYKIASINKLENNGMRAEIPPKKIDKLKGNCKYIYTGITAENFLSNLKMPKEFAAIG